MSQLVAVIHATSAMTGSGSSAPLRSRKRLFNYYTQLHHPRRAERRAEPYERTYRALVLEARFRNLYTPKNVIFLWGCSPDVGTS